MAYHYVPVRSEAGRVDLTYIPPQDAMPASGEELALAVGSQIGRVASAWSEGTSIPLLGPIVRGVVGIGRTAYRFKDNMQENYGLHMRQYGSSGVAVMMRRRF